MDSVNRGRAKSFTSRTGLVILRDHHTKAVMISNEAKINMNDIYRGHSDRDAIAIPLSMKPNPRTHINVPNQSKLSETMCVFSSSLNTIAAISPLMAVTTEVNMNTLLQPATEATSPPTAGPAMFPRATKINTKPTARPFWSLPKAPTAIEKDVP
tara:strand:+ start:546 stop:1010 length:465 start_codon:yes stop_codon:yes gene_type:complete